MGRDVVGREPRARHECNTSSRSATPERESFPTIPKEHQFRRVWACISGATDIPVAGFLPLRQNGGGDAKARHVRVRVKLRDLNGVRFGEFFIDGCIGPDLEALMDATAALDHFVDLSTRQEAVRLRLSTEDSSSGR